MNAAKGLLVSLEGIDGAGKSWQAGRLSSQLRQQGFAVQATLEPSKLAIGKLLRAWLAHDQQQFSAETQAFLFMADRIDHCQKKILPWLQAGNIVICDRFFDSTIAYQGAIIKDDFNWLINAWERFNLPWPDVTFWLDLPVKDALERIYQRQALRKANKSQFEHEKFLSLVADNYCQLQKKHPSRIQAIDAKLDPTALSNLILTKLSPWLKQAKTVI